MPLMRILPNSENIINLFEDFFDEIMNKKNDRMIELSTIIRKKMIEFGGKILESWIINNIGNGYKGYKITKETDGKIDEMKFSKHLSKTYYSCMGEINISRSYYQNQNGGYFPIEEEYPFLKDEFLPDLKELSCYASMMEPYEVASRMLDRIGGIQISSSSLQKITKTVGDKLVEKEDDALKEENNYEKPEKNIDLLVSSFDGAFIKTKNDWKEVKTGVVYEVKAGKDNKQHAINKSYISRIENYKDFGRRIYEESCRRNYFNAKQTVVIGDGGKWIWKISKQYYPKSIEIVDWYHASEHIWDIVECMYGSRINEEGKKVEEKCEDFLYNGLIFEMENLIKEKMQELKIKQNSGRYKKIIKGIKYFNNNEQRMKYSDFEKRGFPIGSGVIEGACKHIVQLRMKKNGMKWSISGAHCVLQLRCQHFSDRWNEVKDVIEYAA
jgi:hypothetical protein